MPPFYDPRMRGFRDRTAVAAVLALLDNRIAALPSESLPSIHAAGRVLAEPVVAPVAVPGFDRAAMDGYALRAADIADASPHTPISLPILGESLPGRPFTGTVGPGEAVRIMTGAPVPAGADAVLPVERTRPDGDRAQILESIAVGRNIGRRGEDITPGNIVLSPGRRLRPQDVGLLASLGVVSVPVVRRPRVDILITGDELLPAGSAPKGYRIVDSNSVMLAALVERDGGIPHIEPILPDRRELIREALLDSAADVILLCGGSSVGQEDHAPGVIAELGELAVHGIALRPASPTGVGFLESRPVFLLPGNPVSCLCAYDLFAGRTVRRFGGRSVELPYPTVSLPLRSKLTSATGRLDYVRVLVRDGLVEPLAVTGASMLSTTTVADGFVLMPVERDEISPGEIVDVHLYDGII
jgi:molybdopterin molybdotransferase